MKNNYFIFIIFLTLFFSKLALADELIFETSELEIVDNGNLLYATKGKAFSPNKNIEIEAQKFEYNKKLDFLEAFDGNAIIKSDNLKIKFDKLELDRIDSTLTAKGNVEIFDIIKELLIETDLVVYDKKISTLKSSTDSILTDKDNNVITSKNFEYLILENILKLEKAILKDFNNNIFEIEIAFLNTQSSKLFGKDISADLNNQTFNLNNEPRIKGKSIIYDNKNTEISKGVFTTCKRREKCPPWHLTAEKIIHDKSKQLINYKNAWLNVYDVPVMYFPKFFHPDPTVERQSGFLIPTIKNSPTSDNYLSVPYFNVISMNKDMTFTPRFYAEDKLLIQTEYRQVNRKSNHIADFSIFGEKDKNSKSHFFYNYDKITSFSYFEDSSVEFNIQQISNDTYLKGNKLQSKLISNFDVMENFFNLNLYSPEFSINSEVKVYEDLTKTNNDRYEFIFPKIDLIKKIDNRTNLNGNFLFKSSNLARNYQTNVFEKININDLIFNSNPKISQSGFYNNYDFIVKNVNSDSQQSSDYKDGENYYLSGLLQLNSSLPLVKENNNFQNVLKPRVALKISPDNSKDISDKQNRLDINNIYNLNRFSSNDTVEGGLSLTYGNDFTVFDKKEKREIFDFKIANNLRIEENDDLPKTNQLGQKTSNFFSEITYSPNKILTTKYNTSSRNNFTDINYENFIAEISINNFVTTFDYLNENNTLDKNSYLLNTTKYSFDKSNEISFSTRENKTSGLTEYYNLMYQYKNDCLAASIEYNKDYYDNRDVKPEENIFLKLTIIPFGEASSPNLKN